MIKKEPLQKWVKLERDGFKPFYYATLKFADKPYDGVARWMHLGETDAEIKTTRVYANRKNILVIPIPSDIAREYIKKNHYLKQIKSAEIPFGLLVFRKEKYKQMYTGEIPVDYNVNTWIRLPKLIGTAIYGTPTAQSGWNSISAAITTPPEVKELLRLYIADFFLSAGKNSESYFIAKTIDLIRQNHTNIKALISYAAPEQKHLGGIYRATNWYYQVTTPPSTSQFQAYSEKTQHFPGGWTHPRNLSKLKIRSTEIELKTRFGYPVALKNCSHKTKYVFLLSKNNTFKTKFFELQRTEITKTFPSDEQMERVFSTYSKLKVWWNETESFVYSENQDPEKYFVHPNALNREKNEIKEALSQIDSATEERNRLEKQIECLNKSINQKSSFDNRLKEINEHLDMIVR